MWDETKPVKLMGALSYDAFSMQHIIDTDKYVAGEILGYDVCGKYAAFCKVCDKTVANPCVTAYRISQRMETVCPMLDSAEIDDARVVQADFAAIVGAAQIAHRFHTLYPLLVRILVC